MELQIGDSVLLTRIYCLVMFAEELQLDWGTSPRHMSTPTLLSPPHGLHHHDLGYQICSSFLRLTGERLATQESSFMEASRCLLNYCCSPKRKEVDTSRTLDTYLEDGSMGLEDEPSFGLPKGRGLGVVSARRNSQTMSEQLREIQERCSEGCFLVVSSWVAEYKTLETRLRFYDSREGGRREEWGGRLEEENLILRKRVELLDMKLQELGAEVKLLKQKNRSLGTSCSGVQLGALQHSHRYFQINHRVYRDIKNYLADKELLLKQQAQRIAEHESRVLASIQAPFADSGCSRCCQILRKLKEAILKFRGYLEGESEQFQRLYDRYKKAMYSVKARPSV